MIGRAAGDDPAALFVSSYLYGSSIFATKIFCNVRFRYIMGFVSVNKSFVL